MMAEQVEEDLQCEAEGGAKRAGNWEIVGCGDEMELEMNMGMGMDLAIRETDNHHRTESQVVATRYKCTPVLRACTRRAIRVV